MNQIEPDVTTDRIANEVIGAALAVHRELGPGFVESIYENALALELEHRSISFVRQSTRAIHYRQALVGEHRLDFVVGERSDGVLVERLVVELKATSIGLAAQHVGQTLSYLKATNLQLGLVINFGMATLREGLKRVVRAR